MFTDETCHNLKTYYSIFILFHFLQTWVQVIEIKAVYVCVRSLTMHTFLGIFCSWSSLFATLT